MSVTNFSAINPIHQEWVHQDQLILNTILGSFSPTLIPIIVNVYRSCDAWVTLTLTYVKPTHEKIAHLKTQLTNQLIKGSQMILELCRTSNQRWLNLQS